MKSIYNKSFNDLEEYFVSMNEKKFKASQVYEWLYKKRVTSFDDMSNLKKEVIEKDEQVEDDESYFFELQEITNERVEKMEKNIDNYTPEISYDADGNYIGRYLNAEGECAVSTMVKPDNSENVEVYFYWREKLIFAYIEEDENAVSCYYYNDDGELVCWIDSDETFYINETDNDEFVKRGEKYWNNSLKALKG